MEVIQQKLTFSPLCSARLHADCSAAGSYLLTNHRGRCCVWAPGSAGHLMQGTVLFLLQWHAGCPPCCLSLSPSPPHVDSLASWRLDLPADNTLPRAFAWSLTMLSPGSGEQHNFSFLQFLILAHSDCLLFVLFRAQMDPSKANVFVIN